MKVYSGQIDQVYANLIDDLLHHSDDVGNTYEINNCCLIIDNPSTKHVAFTRKLSEDYANAELKWYWSADNRCDTIGQHAKMWLRLSDDGKTNNSAYGYILQKKYGFNQIEQIIDLLRKDKTSRRAVLNISDPAINRIETHDMQCTIAIQFLIRNNRLEETVYMRSNDVFFGLPYDYIYFVSIGEYIAEQLGLELGLYTHHATSMHMYKRDVDKFEDKAYELTIDAKKIREENYHA